MNLRELIKKWYIPPIKQYADFTGRTSRKAFWMFILFNMIFAWAAIFIDNILGTHDDGFFGVTNGTFNNLYSLVLLIPGFAITFRRLHDVGEEGSKLFFIFLPIIGWIILLKFLIQEGDPVENKFGPVPAEAPGGPDIGGHPYAPNEKPEAGSEKPGGDKSIDVPAIRKEAEEAIARQKKIEKQTIAPKAKKIKWGLDRGAIDFRTPTKDGKKKV